jgi:hypothetical protein
MDLNTYGIFNDIFQSKINVLHLSKFLRSISWEPSVMIGWASQMDARETLCCHMFLHSKKKEERTLDFNRYKTPPGAYARAKIPSFKKWKAEFFPKKKKMLFPPRVVVDFFFDEEERRYAITRRQRKEHKKGEKLARASQNSPYSNPLCPFFPSSFHSFIFCQREERYKNARFVSLKQKESKRWRKELPPFHPLSSIDLSSIEVYRW